MPPLAESELTRLDARAHMVGGLTSSLKSTQTVRPVRLVSEKLLGVVIYLNRASGAFGRRIEQLCEVCANGKIVPGQRVKVAADVGLSVLYDADVMVL